MLVVGVVAAKLCAARGRIDLHLPPRPIVKLKLLEGRTITICSLSCLLVAIQNPSLHSLQCSVCYRYCNASTVILQFQPAKKVIFGVQPKE